MLRAAFLGSGEVLEYKASGEVLEYKAWDSAHPRSHRCPPRLSRPLTPPADRHRQPPHRPGPAAPRRRRGVERCCARRAPAAPRPPGERQRRERGARPASRVCRQRPALRARGPQQPRRTRGRPGRAPRREGAPQGRATLPRERAPRRLMPARARGGGEGRCKVRGGLLPRRARRARRPRRLCAVAPARAGERGRGCARGRRRAVAAQRRAASGRASLCAPIQRRGEGAGGTVGRRLRKGVGRGGLGGWAGEPLSARHLC